MGKPLCSSYRELVRLISIPNRAWYRPVTRPAREGPQYGCVT